MKEWQSEREDYLASGQKQGGCGWCLYGLLMIVLALAVSSAIMYVAITNQLSK